MRGRLPLAICLALLLCVGLGSARAEPLKLRVGWAVVPSQLTSIIFMKKDILKHYGTSYTFEPIKFRGSAPQITALAAGELDLAALAFSSVGLAIQNAHMDDIRVVADLYQDGIEGYRTSEYMVLADGPIQTIEDLKGKVLGVNAFGSGTDIPLRAMLRKHNLEDKRDLTVIETAIPTMPAMLADHKVDLIALPLPFTANPQVRSTTRTLFTEGDAMGITQLGMWAARAPFIAAHRAALVDFMEDALRAERWYFDPANHKEAVEICVKVTKVPAERWDTWLFRKDGQAGDYYRNPDGKPDIPALQLAVNAQKDLGTLKDTIDVNKYVDLSLAEDAAKRLK